MTGVGPTRIGVSGFAGSNIDQFNPEHFTLAIPPGSEYGDLLIASIITYEPAPLPPGRGLAEVFVGNYGSWAYGLWIGTWDGDTTPLPWRGTGFNNSVGQYFGAFLASYRNRLDPARPPVLTLGPAIPGLPGTGPALCVTWARSSFSGVGSFHGFDGTDWPESVRVDANYALALIGEHADTVAAQTTTSGDFGGSPYMTFGLDGPTSAPPCRLYPREDQLGVNSGRIWPAPKSHQASPRRAGGYY